MKTYKIDFKPVGELTWVGIESLKLDNNPFPPGVLIAMVNGDPTSAGDPKRACEFTFRLKLAAGTKVASYSSDEIENVVALTGTVELLMSDTPTKGLGSTPAAPIVLRSADYVWVGPGIVHGWHATQDSVVQFSGHGPLRVVKARDQ